MPIGTFILQPSANSINAAYRPIVISVRATRTDANPRPPVVYCDIYFNDVFYKTLEKTQYSSLAVAYSVWDFDIQDAAQEYLKKFLAANGEQTIKEATLVVSKALCKFRSSGIDADGFIAPEGTAPIQGTGDNDPVAGTGDSTNAFYIVNATLQHDDNQSLPAHLSAFKKRTWGPATWPLSHRPDNTKICMDDSDSFPIIHGGANDLSCLILNYQYIGQSTFHKITNCLITACPLVTNLESAVVDNGNGTQTFTFTFDALSGAVTLLNIQYRSAGTSDPWTDHSGSTASPRTVTVPLGLYDFRFITSGSCAAQTSDALLGLGITGAVCTPVDIVGAPALPDATEGSVYSYSFNLTGTAPFALASVVKPAWMTITITGGTVNFTGLPDAGDVGADIPVSFDITNCDAGSSTPFSDTINVAALGACTAVFFDPAVVLPDATAFVDYDWAYEIMGDAPFSLSAITKPAWMTIEIAAGFLRFYGTPDESNVGADIAVSVTVSNCAGAHNVVINDTIDVLTSTGRAHKNKANYVADPGAVTDVCTFNADFSRSTTATDDATAAGERILLTYHAVADNGCTYTGTVIFEPTDGSVSGPIDMTCGMGTNYCSGGTISVISVAVIP